MGSIDRHLQSRPARLAATLLSGVLFYFSLRPHAAVAWRVAGAHSAAAGGLPRQLAPGAPARVAGCRRRNRLEFCLVSDYRGAGSNHPSNHPATIVMGLFIGRTRAAVLASRHWLTVFMLPVLMAAFDVLISENCGLCLPSAVSWRIFVIGTKQ